MNSKIAVACRDSNGSPVLQIYSVTFSESDYDEGNHYVLAEEMAEDEGYEGPFICFDHHETGTILSAAKELGLAPSLVAVDLTGGLVCSVTCDKGVIDVCIYDTNPDPDAEDTVELPVGDDGALVEAEAHYFKAKRDSSAELIAGGMGHAG